MELLIWNELELSTSLNDFAQRIENAKNQGYNTIITKKIFSCGELITQLVATKPDKPQDSIGELTQWATKNLLDDF